MHILFLVYFLTIYLVLIHVFILNHVISVVGGINTNLIHVLLAVLYLLIKKETFFGLKVFFARGIVVVLIFKHFLSIHDHMLN